MPDGWVIGLLSADGLLLTVLQFPLKITARRVNGQSWSPLVAN